jgi:hypothetical protein
MGSLARGDYQRVTTGAAVADNSVSRRLVWIAGFR